MYQPLLMNKTTFKSLTPEQQTALTDAAAKAEAFYLEEGKKGDDMARQTFADAGVEIAEMTRRTSTSGWSWPRPRPFRSLSKKPRTVRNCSTWRCPSSDTALRRARAARLPRPGGRH